MRGKASKKTIYIIGAGSAGQSLAKEIINKPILGNIIAFLDDDPIKIGTSILEIPVLGPLTKVTEIFKRYPADEAIIAIPSATNEQLKQIYKLISQAPFRRIRILPRLSQILDNSAHLVQTRDLNPEDLLGRTSVKVDLKKSLAYLRGKRVLITGAGGSIGSELSRQLLSGGAARLYLFGHGENSIYEIDRELRLLQQNGVGEKATIVPILGELQDSDFVAWLLKRLAADVIFHAAAHKHVPLLEENPVEAVKNNVFGTLNLVQAALQERTERFVFISTDKAVEPVSIYGATKLIAEEIVIQAAAQSNKNFMVVRFGNVLGSRGSILPLLQKQIATGGPVSLTHPEVKRFFMTIPEAASLVLKTGGNGKAGELYVLDMGEPILIKDLIYQLIEFYGYVPETEVKINIIGLRPGEKIEESLFSSADKILPTDFPKIMRLERKPILLEDLEKLLTSLKPICYFDHNFPSLYRNKEVLLKQIGEIIKSFKQKEIT